MLIHIHHGRSPFASGAEAPKSERKMEGTGSRQSKTVQSNQGPGGCNGMGSNANSTARNDKEGSYVENEALVGRGAEGETTAEMDAPQKHEHRRRGRKRAPPSRAPARPSPPPAVEGGPELGSLPAIRPLRQSTGISPASSKGPEKTVSPAHTTSLSTTCRPI